MQNCGPPTQGSHPAQPRRSLFFFTTRDELCETNPLAHDGATGTTAESG